MVAQANIAQVERLIKNIQKFWFQGKPMERLAQSQNDLPGSEVKERRPKFGGGALEAKGNKGYSRKSWPEDEGRKVEEKMSGQSVFARFT